MRDLIDRTFAMRNLTDETYQTTSPVDVECAVGKDKHDVMQKDCRLLSSMVTEAICLKSCCLRGGVNPTDICAKLDVGRGCD